MEIHGAIFIPSRQWLSSKKVLSKSYLYRFSNLSDYATNAQNLLIPTTSHAQKAPTGEAWRWGSFGSICRVFSPQQRYNHANIRGHYENSSLPLLNLPCLSPRHCGCAKLSHRILTRWWNNGPGIKSAEHRAVRQNNNGWRNASSSAGSGTNALPGGKAHCGSHRPSGQIQLYPHWAKRWGRISRCQRPWRIKFRRARWFTDRR